MSIKILSKNEIPKIKKLKNEFHIFRVIGIKQRKIEMIELFNNDGVFRGFGKNSKKAFKQATKALKKYYNEV